MGQLAVALDVRPHLEILRRAGDPGDAGEPARQPVGVAHDTAALPHRVAELALEWARELVARAEQAVELRCRL